MNRIYSEKEFAIILNRERARSDRTGHFFSIIIFKTEGSNGSWKTLKSLSDTIRKRIRSCDQIGWVEMKRLAILLPDTTEEGAQKLADNCYSFIFPRKLRVIHTIITYPSNCVNDSQGGTRPDDTDIPQHEEMKRWVDVNNVLFEKLSQSFPKRLPLWKRAMDICGSILCLILFLPVFLLLALYIKKVSPGPIFFKQERVGFLGMAFNCWKFRTMETNAENSVHNRYYSDLIQSNNSMKKLDGEDERIIPYGRVIRKAGLDELPQLVNVLRGEMSLIGPRPCIAYEVEKYQHWQRKRFEAVPGLTGLWQVSGKNMTTFKEMMRYDISYSMKKTLSLDIIILLKTLPAIIDQFNAKM